MRRFLRNLTALLLVSLGPLLFSVGILLADDSAVTSTPYALVPTGVSSYTLVPPKVYWHTGVPPCPPSSAIQALSSEAAYLETFSRISVNGGEKRDIYSSPENCNQGKILGEIAADSDFIYWLAANGLMGISTGANPGDPSQLINALVKGPGEVVDGGDRIYLIQNPGSGTAELDYVLKSNKQVVFLTRARGIAYNLQWDGDKVYYIIGTTLYRLKPGVDSGIAIATGVTGYFAEGSRLIGCIINPFRCFFSDNVFVAKGRQIYVYNNSNDTLASNPIYTSVDTTASVYELTTDLAHLYFYEGRQLPCTTQPCFINYSYVLNRTGRSGGTVDALYTYGPVIGSGPGHLTTDNTFLFWQEDGQVKRLENIAGALTQTNLFITGMEVTQGIQSLTNSVSLIKDRPTYVRLYVKSSGGAVSGVTARLAARGFSVDPLMPINSVGSSITVRSNPDRNDINQSFLFELPWSWLTQDSLTLDAELNPFKVPLETNYSDNSKVMTIYFGKSPSLSVEFFNLNYKIGKKTYSPRYLEDTLRTYSWILRAYPIGGTIGQYFKPRLWDVDGGTVLGNYVNRSDSKCKDVYSKPSDDVALCASYFMNGWLNYYREATKSGDLNVGLKPNAFYYGMISDASNNFPRGQAMYDHTSVGPSGIPGNPFSLGSGWDTDGTYADWYAAHEIGHSLGRAHPNAGSDDPATPNTSENCGHSRSDPSYPYGDTSHARAPIGPPDGSVEGFDRGDAGLGISKSIYPSAAWNDVMSYCASEWLSNYTYTAMYTFMLLSPSITQQEKASSPAIDGDFLFASGLIDPTTAQAGFTFLRRLTKVSALSFSQAGGTYALRFLNASDQTLASISFLPTELTDSNQLSFSLTVNFPASTRKIQIVQIARNVLLKSQNVSSNPPTIGNVALQSAPNPITGTVTLAWTASDLDGDPLVFDVAYSPDAGVTFLPVAVQIKTLSADIDTTKLSGSSKALFRVTASDEVNTASANSPVYSMASKPPQTFILAPANNTSIHYGQLVNFNGMAYDLQDGYIAGGNNLLWKDAKNNVLGNGPMLSSTTLPVGTDVITFQATNSKGQTASTTVTVLVDDSLDLPGPTLTAGPAQIGWQLSLPSNQILTTSLSINNAGGGSMDWTVSSSQPWLTLNTPNGTIPPDGDPATLVLNANPSGFPSGSTLVAYLTLEKPASGNSPKQTLNIPVSVSIGNIHNTPSAPYSGPQALLPILMK